MTTALRVAAAVAVAVLTPAAARAQAAGAPRGRFEIAAGVLWMSGASLGSSQAGETTPGGGVTPLFTSSTDLGASVGAEAHVGVSITGRLQAEASASYAKPDLSTRITGDIEAGGSATATESIEQLTVSGGLLWWMPVRRFGPNLAPFVRGSVGYLRQLHEGRTLVVTGRTFDLGAGIDWPLLTRDTRRLKAAGLRIDGRAVGRTRGVALRDDTHLSAAAGAAFYVRF